MYVSIQTVCTCHGFLLFESIHCDRCRSIIPYQLTDESLVDSVTSNNGANGVYSKEMHDGKQATNMLVPYRKPHHHHYQPAVTTGRVRFRALCPFCNSPTYVLRYYCKRERLYYHLRIQSFGESDQSIYKSVAETQNMNHHLQYIAKSEKTNSSALETVDDSYSLSGSISQQPPSTVLYDQSRVPNSRDMQIENEKKLYALNELEGDLFNVLRNGLFYDTVIQCQDDVKIQVHRCMLGGRSPWFRHLLTEYHDANTQDDYVLQISIDDVQSVIMNEILNFMYTNRCLISLKNAPELLIAAKRFELEKLTKQIADFLLSRLNVDNAIELLISAHEAGSEPLKLACIHLINRNAEKIKRTEKWRTFKTQYVDLIPELYENRVERPAPVQVAFLPDVFSAQEVPSDSLRSLSQLYDNPVKQRLPSPAPRFIPQPTKPQQTVPTTQLFREAQQTVSISKMSREPQQSIPTVHTAREPIQTVPKIHTTREPQQVHTTREPQQVHTTREPIQVHTTREPQQGQSNEPITQGTSGPFVHRHSSTRSSFTARESPVKKRATSVTRPRPAPHPAALTLTRNIFPSVKQTSDVDAYRRPVNIYEKSVGLPAYNQNQQNVQTQVPQKPPPPATIKISRAVSPRRVIELRRSPTLTEIPQDDEHIIFQRVNSVETMD